MLNGVAPILIFSFEPNIAALNPLFNAIEGIPKIGKTLAGIGIPIPIYLDERLTGLYVDTEAKNLDLDTEIKPRYDEKQPYVYQRLQNSSISVNLLATRDSVMLPVLLALSDMIIPKLVSGKYSLSYLNGSTVILGGLLQGLNTSEGADDNLIRITLQIQKVYKPAEQLDGTLKNAVQGETPLRQ